MNCKNEKISNKGFSLVELIVIIAIIAIAAGSLTLSVSLVVGSEAKKAVEKIEASLDEVKTGAMSRHSETLTIQYMDKNVEEGRDKEGFYVVETINTISKGTGTTPVEKREMGKEQRRICDNRVSFTLTYKLADGSETTTDLDKTGANAFIIEYDRATGLFKPVCIDVAGSTPVYYGVPVSLECSSPGAFRTYKIEFIEETGKHVRSN